MGHCASYPTEGHEDHGECDLHLGVCDCARCDEAEGSGGER